MVRRLEGLLMAAVQSSGVADMSSEDSVSAGEEEMMNAQMCSAAAGAELDDDDDDPLEGLSEAEYLPDPGPAVYEDTKLKPRHPCSVCRQCFALRSTWYDHMRQAHNITKPFACEECPKRYSMLGALNYHRLTTHRGVVHACKTCGKRFMTKPGLVRHAKSHFGGVYLCEDCNKTFPTRDSLRRHRQQVHMGEKPHVCHFCQERFGASHSLKRHIKRRHSTRGASAATNSANSDIRPRHACNVCHKAFYSAEALRKHVQSMHQHARYQCETCLRRFSDWSNLSRHRKATRGCMPALRMDPTTGAPSISTDHVTVTPLSAAAAPIVIQHLALQLSGASPSLDHHIVLPAAQAVQELSATDATSEFVEQQQAVPPSLHCDVQQLEDDTIVVKMESLESEEAGLVDAAQSQHEVEFADFALRYGDEAALTAASDGAEMAVLAASDGSEMAGGDTVELQPVNAAELQTLEGDDGQTLLVPVTLTTAGGGGQDVYVTLYPAGGEGSGHRFICVQNAESGATLLAELPVVSEQTLDVN